jgi:hypothetical protein
MRGSERNPRLSSKQTLFQASSNAFKRLVLKLLKHTEMLTEVQGDLQEKEIPSSRKHHTMR